jgi:ankyrin repeat protein
MSQIMEMKLKTLCLNIKRLDRNDALLYVGFLLLTFGALSCANGLNPGPLPGISEGLLFRASSKGDLPEVRSLLDKGTNVNAREVEGETPLMYAAVEDRTEVVKLLLDRGADINALSLNGETALMRAARVSCYETVNLLLARGADIEKGVDGIGTPLLAAAGNGDIRMIKLLLDRGAKIDALNKEGYSPLAAAVSRRASAETVELLISSGADINVRTNRGETPMMVAERNGDPAMVTLLTKKGSKN